ncbi:bifunctional UDP-sugar hydrolase/5'-nucleotidase periplasmic precursor [Raoultella planticola]|uniref:Bifunctional UDP-sugar hydrolase/5'-nucleotidase periplasmic n=1 Tax=Raoultella planticola TaxID=575 RepID=A0A485DC01_RAOPL|nr:bifunctional UDP-sugar hydrolase/5'-nucleotidase periplasmic precursor [Raoultella planticola]
MIVGGHSQDPVCMASENKKQIDYVPGTPCAPDRQNGDLDRSGARVGEICRSCGF